MDPTKTHPVDLIFLMASTALTGTQRKRFFDGAERLRDNFDESKQRAWDTLRNRVRRHREELYNAAPSDEAKAHYLAAMATSREAYAQACREAVAFYSTELRRLYAYYYQRQYGDG